MKSASGVVATLSVSSYLDANWSVRATVATHTFEAPVRPSAAQERQECWPGKMMAPAPSGTRPACARAHWRRRGLRCVSADGRVPAALRHSCRGRRRAQRAGGCEGIAGIDMVHRHRTTPRTIRRFLRKSNIRCGRGARRPQSRLGTRTGRCSVRPEGKLGNGKETGRRRNFRPHGGSTLLQDLPWPPAKQPKAQRLLRRSRHRGFGPRYC